MMIFSSVSGAGAAVTCDAYAAPGGNDSAPGSEAAPFESAQHLMDTLLGGQVGCLRAGTYSAEEFKVTGGGFALTSYPGETATLKGRFWIAQGSNDVSFSNLSFDGRNSRGLPSPVVNSADVTFDSVDVTNHYTGICFKLGDIDYGRAVRTVIEHSKVHECGKRPSGNQDHGIYIGQSDGAIIRDNWIYDNVDRGVQVYPDAQGTVVAGNVIDGNGEGVVISGDGSTASRNTEIRGNIISNSKIRWNVESNWPGGVVGSGNAVNRNCLVAGNSASYYDLNGGILPESEGAKGFTASGNIIASPGFADRAGKDFTVSAGSDCASVYSGGDDTAGSASEPADPPQSSARISIKVLNRAPVSRSTRVSLTGKVWAPKTSHARRIQISKFRHGSWRKVRGARVTRSGHFRIRTRFNARRGSRRIHLRASVPGVARSRAVTVRTKRI